MLYVLLDDDETILPIHQKELDKFTSKDEEFSEEIPGENIFPEFKELVRVRKFIVISILYTVL